jgi:hypothetical protein
LYADTPEITKERVKLGVLYCCLGTDAAILYNACAHLVKQVHSESSSLKSETYSRKRTRSVDAG